MAVRPCKTTVATAANRSNVAEPTHRRRTAGIRRFLESATMGDRESVSSIRIVIVRMDTVRMGIVRTGMVRTGIVPTLTPFARG